MSDTSTTLGEKLAPKANPEQPKGWRVWLLNAFFAVLGGLLSVCIVALPLWWLLAKPNISFAIIAVLFLILLTGWFIVYLRPVAGATPKADAKPHPLLVNDKQGFMSDLVLDTKAAIIDGSNIYHFGHDNELDAQVLGMVAEQLREEEFRIVCFFDANIFYRLAEHGAFDEEEAHSLGLLTEIFGLLDSEIYVVPSGVQADLYVLSCLRHLPNSFAVTNDRFRDYAKQYGDVMKGDEWRKGVRIDGAEIKLFKHKFKQPLRLN